MVGILKDDMRRMIEICNCNAQNDDQIRPGDDGEISPSENAPALLVAGGNVTARSMKWGFPNKDGKLIINARAEDLENRVTFRRLVREKRCVLPACGYYEWRRPDHLKYCIRMSDETAFYLAGLYRIDDNGKMRFVVLTRNAYGAHARLHHRMPVTLLTREEARGWLNGSLSVADLLAHEMESFQIEPMDYEQLSMDFDV